MAKVPFTINAKATGTNQVKGLTKSIVAAQLATQAIIAVGKKLIEVGKQSIEAFKKQEQAEAKLQAAVGGNIQEFKDFAAEMQRVTTVGDETTLEILQLASSMGVANDSLTEVAQNTIALSKSLGVSEKQAVKFAAAIESGNTTMLNRYIPALQTATTEAEKQTLFATDSSCLSLSCLSSFSLASRFRDDCSVDSATTVVAVSRLLESFSSLVAFWDFRPSVLVRVYNVLPEKRFSSVRSLFRYNGRQIRFPGQK